METLIFTGGGQKCPVSVGFAKAVSETPDSMEDLQTVYGGSGNSITASCLAGNQISKLEDWLKGKSFSDHIGYLRALVGKNILDVDNLINNYRALDLDIGAILHSTRGLVIPITNFDSGKVEWCTNDAVPTKSSSFIMETADDLWEVIRLAQTMPGLVKIKERPEFEKLPPARRGDSYNSSSPGLLIKHAVEAMNAKAITVVDTTRTPNPETDLQFASFFLRLNVTKGNYLSARTDGKYIEESTDNTGSYNGCTVNYPDLNRPFPVESLFSTEPADRNLEHGYVQGRTYLLEEV